MVEVGGYTGRYLEVDLTSGKFQVKETPRAWMRNYVGGTGFAARYLWDHLSPGIDPLGPENKLIFSTCPLTGTGAVRGARAWWIAKSPLTGTIGFSCTGGYFPAEIKFAGYDMIIFEGKADEPVYLWIEDDEVEIRSAIDLWGKDVSETE